MLNILLESRAPRAPRTRRFASAVASAALHVALVVAAVALTMPGSVDATVPDLPPAGPIWIAPPTPAPPAARPSAAPAAPSLPEGLTRSIAAPVFTPHELPPIDVGPAIPPDEIRIGGGSTIGTGSPLGAGDPALLGGGGVLDERMVDRAPRIVGRALEPRYPAPLREAGVQGRVVVQFVVDTLGRAELGELHVVESAHPLFVDAVRAALARYRFTVGESGGRKVRTRVQIPFDFTLVK